MPRLSMDNDTGITWLASTKGWKGHTERLVGVSELHWSTYRPRPAGEVAWLISGDLSHNYCIVRTHTSVNTDTISRAITNTISRAITSTISRTIANTISRTIANTNCQKLPKPATAEFFLAPLMSTWVAIYQLRRNKQEDKYNQTRNTIKQEKKYNYK